MKTEEAFHFSPRENRAHEIGWMPWGEAAFERARREDKPILLSISAVWCHWCHVMDETSYSDPQVIATINDRYVPVRVDNDRRPDVNARYNMGGWPTTAFLAPDGSTLTGATYLTPAQMQRALADIAEFYAGNKAEIAERAVAQRGKRPSYQPAAADALRDAMVVRLIEELRDGYDAEYGGFGDAPKFPQPELLEFLLAEWRATGDDSLHAMVARTILGMSRGGTYDHVEGGFFRYSTTRDWSVPHFEKMAEDHAGLLRVLAQLELFAPSGSVRETLISALGYLRAVLLDPQTHFFGGSQDADEAYFALPLDERRARGAPYVDRTSYTNWTCALAGGFALASRALDDDALLAIATQTLDAVHERLRDDAGLLHHYVEPGGDPQVRGLLTDQAACLRALIDLHEIGGEARFLDRALELEGRLAEHFEAADGGFYDRIAADTLGRLDVQDRPIVDNALVAESLLRLAALTHDPALRERAERVLTLYARTYAAAGSFAAPYARALRRYLTPEVTVRIAGAPGGTSDFREAAARLPAPFVAVRTEPASGPAAAYVCAGTRCGPPVASAAELRAAFDAVMPPAE